MLERNRSFGRVSRPVDKAAAPRQALERQRKLGRAKHATVAPTKPQAVRFREMTKAAKPAPDFLEDDTLKGVPAPAPLSDALAAKLAELVALPPIASHDAPNSAAKASNAVIVAADDAAPILSVAMDPAARPMPPTPRHAPRRRPVLRLAVAASVAVACLLAFARFSDAHLPAPAVPSLTAPVAVTGTVAPVGEPRPQAAAPILIPIEAAALPPRFTTAAYGTDDLAEAAPLPPSTAEQLTARAAALPDKADAQAVSAPAARKPVAKPAVSRNTVLPRRREATAQERSRGPILDFLSDLIP